jgi:pimeloyl-ACP methyl ester carboxylesterase
MRRYVERGCFSESLLREYLSWLQSPDGQRWYFYFFAHYSVEAPPRLRERLEDIDVPTAIIYGDRDAYVPFRTAEELAARIPNAQLTRLRGAGHYLPEECPDEVTRAVEQLLDRQTS